MGRRAAGHGGCRAGCVAVLVLAASTVPVRAGPCGATPSPFWKNAIDFPDDPFRASGPLFGDPGWVKFTVLTCDPATVYFQHSVQYPFHFEFATAFLDPFLGMHPGEFNEATLYNEGRLGVLGAVVLPPPAAGGGAVVPEYGIQLVGQDPFAAQDVVDLFNTVRSAVDAGPEVQAFYFPSFEQLESAEQNAEFFAQHGIVVSSPARWLDGNSCYAEGWALGRLKFFPADQIDAAFLSGALEPADILLTDGIPADVPLVAGIVSLTPATPNSHVAILAGTFRVPFVFLGAQSEIDAANALIGRRIVLRAFGESSGLDLGPGCDVRLIDVEDELTAQQIEEILALKVPPSLNIAPVTPLGLWSRNTDSLTPAHVRYFGGKASNFGFLRRSIPHASPKALGLSFDLWLGFLSQTLAGGATLRQHVDAVLAGHSYPPADMQAFAEDLQQLRDLIENESQTVFTPAQRAAVIAALQEPQYGFDPSKKIRFRSSTNVEDTEQFVGAGLYDSTSGCLADDLDGNGTGPSLCDPAESNEKGVFRAIRMVFASFYKTNAVLERLRYGIDEANVGMAILVHHSFVDNLELTNGVALLTRIGEIEDEIRLVTQLGAIPVTNPIPGTLPEVVDVSVFLGGDPIPTLVESSNLVLLGETVMTWPSDYVGLSELLVAAADRYELETGKTSFVLDFEYKKVLPGGGAVPAGGLVVKQIRELPQPDTTPSITPFLVNEPTELVPFHSPPGRIKTRLTLTTRNLWLEPAALAGQSIYDQISMQFTDGCRPLALAGAPSALPDAAHTYSAPLQQSLDSFSLHDLPNPRDYTFVTNGLGALVSAAQSPILTIRDLARFGLPIQIDHRDPVPQYPGSPRLVTHDSLTMIPALDPDVEVYGCRTIDAGGGVSVDTCYWIHPPPLICAGCAPILSRFDTSVVHGVTTQPILFDDFLSQTYGASSHAFFETFGFEPQLEQGIPLATLQELDAAGIRLIEFDLDNIFELIDVVYYDDVQVGQVCAAPAAAGRIAGGPLRLARAAGGDLELSWGAGCLTSDDDFAIYEGTLGEFGSHEPCTCSTGGQTEHTLTPAAFDAYYLVVPRNASLEGSYGLDGTGAERPPTAEACTAQALASCP
jgi:hypothetical protein